MDINFVFHILWGGHFALVIYTGLHDVVKKDRVGISFGMENYFRSSRLFNGCLSSPSSKSTSVLASSIAWMVAISCSKEVRSLLIKTTQPTDRDAFNEGYRMITFAHNCRRPVEGKYYTDCKCKYSGRTTSMQLCKVVLH